MAVIFVLETAIGFSLVLFIFYCLAALLPSLAVLARRLHDTGRSGVWLWIGLVPVAGAIILIVFLCEKGQAHHNKYGEMPDE